MISLHFLLVFLSHVIIVDLGHMLEHEIVHRLLGQDLSEEIGAHFVVFVTIGDSIFADLLQDRFDSFLNSNSSGVGHAKVSLKAGFDFTTWPVMDVNPVPKLIPESLSET